jgi:cytochrome P450/nitrite reductase/ring-hydroxylating ferredoxin subunit
MPAERASAGRGLTRVARAGELRGDGPHGVSAGGVELVLLRAGGGWRAYDGRCPHQGALLGEGELDGSDLVCRNHRWRFEAASGRRVGGAECLRSCPVELRDGEIWVDPAPLLAPPAQVGARGVRRLDDLPGPRGAPLVGNLAALLDLPRLHTTLERWARAHGPMYVFRAGRRPFVVVSDRELIEQVLRARPESYRRLTKMAVVIEELGAAGVFSAEGAAWRPQRRLAMEALSHRHLSGFYPTLRTVAERLRRRWDAAAEAGRTTDLLDDFKRFTVDVTSFLAFGHDMNTLEQGADVIQRRLEVMFPAVHRRVNALVPYWRVVRLPADRRVDRAVAELRAWLAGLIARARERLAADPAAADRPSNFLEAMLAARDEAGRPFDDQVIIGNAFQMLLAGEDTTANTAAWAVHHLLDDAAALGKLRAEVDEVLDGATVPREIEEVNRLSYAMAVANETLRLRPVVPYLFIEPNQDVVVGDVRVPRHTAMVMLLRAPAQDARHFGAPEAFRPDRWLGDGGHGAHEPAASMPFGTGPRICPGRSLGLLEARVMLATLYRSFDVERVGDPAAVQETFAFTMTPRALVVRLRRRSGEDRT